ncbi:MAG: phosphoribosyl transferase [Dehalococcoidia bacterium]|nr:phosphoribosyl transferase [Dehalococcoidia bacterium]
MNTPNRPALFENRYDAGAKLAGKLAEYAGMSAVVLAIPNGGVPVAVPIALALGAELDIVVARKLPIPLRPEGGFGAVVDDGTTIFNEAVLAALNLDEHQINYQINKVREDIRRRSLAYRNNRALSLIKGKTAIIVDDGLASGYTMLAAVESVKRRQPSRVIVAVPAASEAAIQVVEKAAQSVTTIETSRAPRFYIADYYRYWNNLSDEDGVRCFKDWRARRRGYIAQQPTSPAPLPKIRKGLF